MDIKEFLQAERVSDDEWTFHIGRELHGAFGGAFGGMLAACAVLASREVAPGRAPAALDCRFVRGLPAGAARTRATVLHSGRSLTNVSVDITDERDRLATRATVSLADPAALSALRRPGPRVPDGWKPFEDATPWPAVAPIVGAIHARSVGSGEGGFATGVRVPWDEGGSAEAACLAGDMSVGMPLGQAAAGEGVSTPNPDLALRFCGEVTTRDLVGLARCERAGGGVAIVAIEVWSGQDLVAVGVSSALLLG